MGDEDVNGRILQMDLKATGCEGV